MTKRSSMKRHLHLVASDGQLYSDPEWTSARDWTVNWDRIWDLASDYTFDVVEEIASHMEQDSLEVEMNIDGFEHLFPRGIAPRELDCLLAMGLLRQVGFSDELGNRVYRAPEGYREWWSTQREKAEASDDRRARFI